MLEIPRSGANISARLLRGRACAARLHAKHHSGHLTARPKKRNYNDLIHERAAIVSATQKMCAPCLRSEPHDDPPLGESSSAAGLPCAKNRILMAIASPACSAIMIIRRIRAVFASVAVMTGYLVMRVLAQGRLVAINGYSTHTGF